MKDISTSMNQLSNTLNLKKNLDLREFNTNQIQQNNIFVQNNRNEFVSHHDQSLIFDRSSQNINESNQYYKRRDVNQIMNQSYQQSNHEFVNDQVNVLMDENQKLIQMVQYKIEQIKTIKYTQFQNKRNGFIKHKQQNQQINVLNLQIKEEKQDYEMVRNEMKQVLKQNMQLQSKYAELSDKFKSMYQQLKRNNKYNPDCAKITIENESLKKQLRIEKDDNTIPDKLNRKIEQLEQEKLELEVKIEMKKQMERDKIQKLKSELIQTLKREH